MGKRKAAQMARKDPAEIIFDRALQAVALSPRTQGETLSDYIDRKEWGPYARAHLMNARDHAEQLDQVGATAAASSARQHFDNPNPPDSKPLKP
jgi:hypothetical protein